MAFNQTLYSEIEINRSPERVRAVMLDFSRYPEWHQGFTVTPLNKTTRPADLQPGEKLRNDFDGTVMTPTIVENTPETFQWRGNFYGLVQGHHQFRFGKSTKTPGSTTFVQKEDFHGVLAWMFAPARSYGKKTAAEFQLFNAHLKDRVESLYPGQA